MAETPRAKGKRGDRGSQPQAEVIEGLFDDGPPDPPPLRAIPGSGDASVEETPVQEFFIPIHAFVRLTRREVRIVDHPAFQRLGDVLQLGQTYLVYRGATHCRHEHALGTLHVAQMIIEALARNANVQREEAGGNEWQGDGALTSVESAFVRLGALLHDIGHLPAGHTFEDELGLFAKHDSLERLDLVLGRTRWQGVDVEPLARLVDDSYGPLLKRAGIDDSPSELLRALVAGDYPEERQRRLSAVKRGFRLQVCRDLIGNTICADLLDYLHRDLHHLGKHKQFDTRLIDYMEVRRSAKSGESSLVINLRDGDKVRHDAISGVLDLLESRYQLFEAALYHRTKLAAAAMLERAVAEIADTREDAWLDGLPERLLDVSDLEMLSKLRADAVEAGKSARGVDGERLRAAAESLVALRQRRLQRKLYQRFWDQFTPQEAKRVQSLYGYDSKAGSAARRVPAENRLAAMRKLEEDFDLPPLSLGMYCPPATMSTKVAYVNILRDGKVGRLADQEAEESGLTGGHLQAQQRRFRNLWHVYFSCDREVLADLERRKLYPLLIEAIDCFVLGRDAHPLELEERAMLIAQTLSAAPESRWHGKEIVESVPVARRGGKDPGVYPSGLPTLSAFFRS